MPNFRHELRQAINAAAAGEKAKAAQTILDETDEAIRNGTVTDTQLRAVIDAHQAVGDFNGAAPYKVALTRLVNAQR